MLCRSGDWLDRFARWNYGDSGLWIMGFKKSISYCIEVIVWPVEPCEVTCVDFADWAPYVGLPINDRYLPWTLKTDHGRLLLSLEVDECQVDLWWGSSRESYHNSTTRNFGKWSKPILEWNSLIVVTFRVGVICHHLAKSLHWLWRCLRHSWLKCQSLTAAFLKTTLPRKVTTLKEIFH